MVKYSVPLLTSPPLVHCLILRLNCSVHPSNYLIFLYKLRELHFRFNRLFAPLVLVLSATFFTVCHLLFWSIRCLNQVIGSKSSFRKLKENFTGLIFISDVLEARVTSLGSKYLQLIILVQLYP